MSFPNPVRRPSPVPVLGGLLLLLLLPPLLFGGPAARAQAAAPNYGNDNPTGVSGLYNATVTTAGTYSAYTGNAVRSIPDLVVPGATGAYALAWRRTSTSRYVPGPNNLPTGAGPFGDGGNWRHSYHWGLVQDGVSPTSGVTVWKVFYPDGRVIRFDQAVGLKDSAGNPVNDPFLRGPRGGTHERFDAANLVLHGADGGRVTFALVGDGSGGSAYRAQYLDDPYGLRTTLAYDAQGKLIQVTEPGGRYLQITYGVLEANGRAGAVSNQLVVVDHVTASNGQSVFYAYETFDAGAGQGAYAALQTVSYRAEGIFGYYSYQDSNNGGGGRPQLFQADDPHYPGSIVKMRRGLAQQVSAPAGLIAAEISDLSNTNVSTFNPTAGANDHTEQRGDMTEEGGGTTLPVRDFGYAYGDYQLSNQGDYEGQTTYLGYDPNTNDLSAVKDRRGNQTNLAKEPILGKTTNVAKPDGSQNAYQYGSDPLNPYFLTRSTDDAGHATTYTRDPSTHLVSRIDCPDGGYETFTYNGLHRLTSRRTTRGAVITLRYDEAGSGGSGFPGLLTSVSSPHDQDNNVTDTVRYHYDALDRVDTVTDPRGNATAFAYNGRHQLTRVTHPDAGHTHADYAYDAYGNRTSRTDELGHTWSWTYDEHRRPLTLSLPVDQGQQSRVFNYAYDRTTTDANGNPVTVATAASTTARGRARVTFPSGRKVKRVYEANGWLRAVVLNPDNVGGLRSRTEYTYNPVGQVESAKQVQLNRTILSTHDNRNRLATVTDNAGHLTQYAYYPAGSAYAGNLQTLTRPDGRVYTYSQYDNLNRPTTLQAPDQSVEVTNYNAAGDPVDVRDRRNRAYTYTFDLLGRRRQLRFPDGSHEDYTYDAAGNLATFVNRAGTTQTYRAYDVRNRPTGYDWNDGGLTPGVTVGYDDANRLAQLNNAGANLSYAYTAAGELLAETEAIAGANPQTVGYHPDVDGANAALDYPSGYSLFLDRDARDQIGHLGLNPTGQTGNSLLEGFYSYYADGSLAHRYLGNQTQTAYTEDAIGRVTETDDFCTNNAAHQDITHRTYGHLADGQMSWFKKLSDPTLPGSPTENNTGDGYTYDNVDRLGAAYHEAANVDTAPDSHGDSAANGALSGYARFHQYAYDTSGNRTQANDNGVGTTYATVNDLNQYTSLTVGGTAYSLAYDGQGNLSSYAGSTYAYDAYGWLRQATKTAKTTTTVTFLRDAKGRVVRKTVNGVGQDYYYTGWSLLEERPTAAPTTLGRLYVYGAGGGAPTASLDGPGMGATAGRRLYYHFDARGYVTAATDAGGAVAERYLYDAFGAPHFLNPAGQEIAASAVANRFTFGGQQWLPELGLYDLRHRAYHPGLGRFLQADPVRFGGGDRNLYAYCANDPVNASDPSGLAIDDASPSLHPLEYDSGGGTGESGYGDSLGGAGDYGGDAGGGGDFGGYSGGYGGESSGSGDPYPVDPGKSDFSLQGTHDLGPVQNPGDAADTEAGFVNGVLVSGARMLDSAVNALGSNDLPMQPDGTPNQSGPGIFERMASAFDNFVNRQAAIDTSSQAYQNASGLGEVTATAASILTNPEGVEAVAGESVLSEYNLTRTVENNVATRPYINSPLTVRQIESTGLGVPDPGGVPGALRYDVPGSFTGSQGSYELVIHPETRTIYHFLFRSGG